MATDAVRRASLARQELTQTQAAFDAMRAAAFEQIATSKPAEADFRERLYLTVQVIDALRKHLHDLVSNETIEEYVAELREQHG